MLNDSTYKLSDFVEKNSHSPNFLTYTGRSQQESSISNDEQGINTPPIITPVDTSYSLTHSPKVHNETAPQVAGKQKLAPANQLTGKNTGLNSSQLDAGHYYNTTDENTSTIIKKIIQIHK